MKILALDIGAGTEDILIYDSEKNIENCIKLVLPAPSRVLAARVREATRLYRDLFINGEIIGGGAFTHALKDHLEKGLQVIMTENTAYTVRNDLEEVRELGIKIAGEPPADFEGETLTVEEINLTKLKAFLPDFGEPLSDIDIVSIAVQDHGTFPKGTSNRRFRIQKTKELLEGDPRPESLAFKENEIPSCFLRMKSAAQSSKRQMPNALVLLMDTSPAAILGCLEDPVAEKAEPVLAINVGNGHTMAAIVSREKVVGIMEHHTRMLNPQKIKRLLVDFADGKITNEELFEDGGHGLFYLKEPPSFSKIAKVVATGPNRNLLYKTDFPVHFASPAGDVMMTGPVGLVEAAKKRFKLI
jgi:uncharacterized protein (DUF1786 family)